jgi:hypothetical protein
MAYIGNSCIYIGSTEWGIGSDATDGETVPVAVVNPTELFVAVNAPVRLDASGSYTDDVDILYYEWVFVTKPENSTAELVVSGAEVLFVPDAVGAYVISLVVRGAKSGCSDPLLISVNATADLQAWSKKFSTDYSWIWQLLPDFWNLVPARDRAKIENFWNGLGQVVSSDVLKLYNVDGNKSIATIQDRILARWLKVDPVLAISDTTFILNEPTDVVIDSNGTKDCTLDEYPLITASPRISCVFLNAKTIRPSEALNADTGKKITFQFEGRDYTRVITGTVDGVWQVSENLPFSRYPINGACALSHRDDTDVFYSAGRIETITRRVKNKLTLANTIDAEDGTFFCVLRTPADYGKLGVSPGDILISKVTDVGETKVLEIRSEVVAVSPTRIMFRPALGAEWITDSDADAAAKLFGITKNTFKKIFNLPRFRWRYFNTELTPTDVVTVGDLSFRITPSKIIRNSKILLPTDILSVLTLNEFITEVTVENGLVSSEYGATLDLGRDQISFNENDEYIVTNLQFVGGGLTSPAGSLTVESDTADFELHEVLPGDVLVITTGVCRGEFTIAAVDGNILTLTTPIPRPVNEDDFRIQRKIPANYIKFTTPFTWDNPCPVLWAETYILDNGESIEANFGDAIKLTKEEHLSWNTKNTYKSVVEALLGAKMLGPNFETFNKSVSTAIGIPVAKSKGIIRIIDNNILAGGTRGRIVIEDVDDLEAPLNIFRIYTFTDNTDVSYTPLSGLSANPRTGIRWGIGDIVESGDVLGNGVLVEDRYTSRDFPVVGPLGYHIFRLLVDSDSVPLRLDTLEYLVSFVREVRPHYVWILLTLVKYLVDYINIDTEIFFKMRARLFDDAYHIDFGANIFDEFLHIFQRLDLRKVSVRTVWPCTDLQIRAGGIVYSATGGFVTAPANVDFGGEPPVANGDVLLIPKGRYAGIYDITGVIDDNTLQTDSTIFVVDDDTPSVFKIGRQRIGLTAHTLTRDVAVQELFYPPEAVRNIDIAPGDLVNINTMDGGTLRANTHIVTGVDLDTDAIRVEPPYLTAEVVSAVVVRPWIRPSQLYAGNVPCTGEYISINGRDYGILIGDTLQTSSGMTHSIVALSEEGYLYIYPKLPAGVYGVKIYSKLNSDDLDAMDRTLRKIEELVVFKLRGAGSTLTDNYIPFGFSFSLADYPAKVGDIIKITADTLDIGEGAGILRVVDIDAGGVYTNYHSPSPKPLGFELWKHTPGWIREI